MSSCTPIRCPGPIVRREFMRIGSLALGGIALPQVLAGKASARQSKRDTSVILLYLHGGPSQLETYDLKPDAPLDYRSVFNPIRTNVAGMDICELFPLQAKLGDKIALVRSLHHTMSSHSDGGIEVLTGKTPSVPDATSQSKSQHPDLGSVVSEASKQATLPYVAIPQAAYMTRPAYLGIQHGALVAGDPSVANYRPPIGQLVGGLDGKRLADRRFLLKQFDRFRAGADLHDNVLSTDEFRNQALRILTSSGTAAAFDISKESDDLRDRYGRNLWGQSCLLARRLCEAGTSVVSVFINTPKSGKEFTNWDDHILNAGRPGHFAKYMQTRLPYLDQAVSALIEDVYGRNREESIMIVVMGEFGRTPRLSRNNNGVGRDHWPQAYTVLFSGGGLRTGQIVGATNAKGEFPTERPYTPQDVLATIYRHLGVDYHRSLTDHTGRPVPILRDGEPIKELI